MILLESGNFYHLYNRGNNKEDIFYEDRNYEHFLNLYRKYVTEMVETYAYCLMKNHFHFLVRVKEPTCEVLETSQVGRKISRQFSHLFNAYAKAFNKAYRRTGSLFQERFRRKLVSTDHYLVQTISYIHANPQRHRAIKDFRKYPYSSYHAIISNDETFLEREKVIQYFGNKEKFIEFHQDVFEEENLRRILEDEQDPIDV